LNCSNTLWNSIAKKYNGLGLTSISMACGAIALGIEPSIQCVLCILC
ncbi:MULTISPECIES: DUF3693 domain-containing protein, partial [unclassified Vibrio]